MTQMDQLYTLWKIEHQERVTQAQTWRLLSNRDQTASLISPAAARLAQWQQILHWFVAHHAVQPESL